MTSGPIGCVVLGLSSAEIPYPVETVHNAAVVKHGSEYIMLFRSHLRTGRSIIGLARSADGFRFSADPQPFLTPDREGPFAAYEEFGVEDPRVTLLEGEYIITYSAYSRNGVRIALAKTRTSERWRGSPSSLRRIIEMW
jgi:beta-1,2-mannobiose phosphorylase / 1,2-beta-oligomannan phosphorylase